MKKLLILLLALVGCVHAQDTAQPSRSEQLRAVFDKAAKRSGIVKDAAPVRTVRKGAKPEILLSPGKVVFNGTELRFGARVADWKAVIGGEALCSKANEKPVWCKWDGNGIEIGGTLEKPDTVEELRVYLNRDANELEMKDIPTASGRKRVEPVWLAKGVFRGYLAIDQFGVDARTTFREIQNGVSADYRLRCGLAQCTHPHGNLGPELNIQMVLMGTPDDGVLKELSLYRP
ncbi:hypothetical protein IP91_00268 [Pseudoduganella lurida]|uniref:DUF7738 domain-containing protein n=1 Tax=Pseudoduganella lurida TaxID=1036180 RepID=A0A562RJE6_9BURK|nr:hypothetical protein [Pseudoduganella lurida]TWI69202.1 hypothetical protein IP91_00268 [Pseudoduganella lurida]